MCKENNGQNKLCHDYVETGLSMLMNKMTSLLDLTDICKQK